MNKVHFQANFALFSFVPSISAKYRFIFFHTVNFSQTSIYFFLRQVDFFFSCCFFVARFFFSSCLIGFVALIPFFALAVRFFCFSGTCFDLTGFFSVLEDFLAYRFAADFARLRGGSFSSESSDSDCSISFGSES